MSETPDATTLRQSAHDLLTKLQRHGAVASTSSLTASLLRPRPEDYEKVFDPMIAASVRETYEPFWLSGTIEVRPKPGQTALMLAMATTEDLQADTPSARAFPGGYRQVAAYLQPGRVWVRWKYVEPGESLGMAYDGMVWIDDHWAWFPKPWKAARINPTAGPVAEA